MSNIKTNLESHDVGHIISIMDIDGKTHLVDIMVSYLSRGEINIDIDFSAGRKVCFIQQWDSGKRNLSQVQINNIISAITNSSFTIQSTAPKTPWEEMRESSPSFTSQDYVVLCLHAQEEDLKDKEIPYGEDEENLCPDCD